jgi:hypothetical protein
MNTNVLLQTTSEPIEQEVGRPDQVPVTSRDNFLIHNKGFNYYGIDLSSADIRSLEDIIGACEMVEKSTWTAQENFYEYFRKCDLLIYAEKDGQVAGFCLASLLLINEYCFFTNDETMVLKEYQGFNIALYIVTTAFLYFMKKLDLGKSIKKFIYVSISANPQVVNGYYQNKYWNKFDNSYHPSKELINIHQAYLEKYNMALVDGNFPFCVKNLFPGSQHLDWTKKKFQFKDEVQKLMPPAFDHKERGDAWAFMFMTNMRGAYKLFLYMALAFIGKKTFFNERLGLFRRKKHLLVNPKLTRVRLIDGRFSDRRTGDRRGEDRRTNNTGHDGITKDRRATERRSIDRRISAL